MANYIPFEQLKVGETYYMYSTYSWRTLGTAKIAELDPSNGTGSAYSSWGEQDGYPFRFGVDDGFYDCMFWDAEPTREEVNYQREHGKKYVPPRTIEGKNYDGGSVINDDLKKLLDDFIEKMNRTFETDNRFKPDKYNGRHLFMWESKLDYVHPCEVFITNGGKCDWDTIEYVMQNGGVNIHAGERDSFGWLTGAIDKRMPDGTLKTIMYG